MSNNYSQIIKIGLIVNLLVYLYAFYFGYDRPFWIDEIHVVGASQAIFNISLKQVFIENIMHPPLYFYLVGIVNLLVENLYFLRVVNILGFIPLFFAFILLKKYYKDLDLYFIFLLFISNYLFFYYSLELKMYFLIYCISFLQHTIFLIDPNQNKFKTLFFITCVVNTLLHVFGLVISMSMILIYMIINIKNTEYKKVLFNLILGSILFFLFCIMFYYSTLEISNFKALGWIEFQKWYFRVFLEWSIPVVFFVIFMFFVTLFKEGFSNFFSIKKNSNFNLKILYITLPSIILVVVTSIISLKFPVITHRNLIVTLPAGILLCGLISINFFRYKGYSIILIILILLTTYVNFFSFKNGVIYAGENIEWVIKKTYKKSCKNVPVYFNDAQKILFRKLTNFAVDIYAEYPRELRRLSELNRNSFDQLVKNNPNCDIFIASFHERSFEKKLKNLFPENNNMKIIIAPDVLEKNSKSGAILLIEK